MSDTRESVPAGDLLLSSDEDRSELFRRVEDLLRGEDVAAAMDLLTGMHPADSADLFQRLDDSTRGTMLALLSAEQQAHLIGHMDEEPLRDVVDLMPRASLARVLDLTDNDVAADVLRLLPPAEAVRTLAGMQTATEITPLLAHSDESAGGIMTRGYVALHKEMTVGEALAYLRATRPVAEEVYYLYVLDAGNRLQGIVNLRQLVISGPEARIEDVMTTDVLTVAPGTDQEEAANLLQRYRLRTLPVVSEERVLEGIITSDDVIDVLQEEATEDMYQLIGLPGDETVYTPITESARRRIPWLFINLIAAFAAAGVVAIFEDTIAKAAALAIFMPIVAGQGGNSGIQTITIVVRAMALGEIERRDAARIVRKEATIGILKGLAIGAVVGLVAWVWQGNIVWGIVVAAALAGNMLVAGAVGTLIPLGLRSLKLDPALASGIFLQATTDVVGFLFLLGLATLTIGALT